MDGRFLLPAILVPIFISVYFPGFRHLLMAGLIRQRLIDRNEDPFWWADIGPAVFNLRRKLVMVGNYVAVRALKPTMDVVVSLASGATGKLNRILFRRA
jgi:hypothetical protein